MARQHGKDVRVYFGGRDASGDLISIGAKFGSQSHDATTFASGGWMESDSGMKEWSAEIAAFHNPAVGGIGRQLEDLLGASGVLSIYDDNADAIGDSGVLLSSGMLESRNQPISVGDMIKLDGAIKGSGRPGMFGKLLHPKGEETVTGAESSLDNAASSANGGRGNLHVTAITGTWTITIEQSSDNGGADAWSTLVAFTAVAAVGGVVAETKEVAGTVERYLRVSSIEGTAGTIEFTCGFARY